MESYRTRNARYRITVELLDPEDMGPKAKGPYMAFWEEEKTGISHPTPPQASHEDAVLVAKQRIGQYEGEKYSRPHTGATDRSRIDTLVKRSAERAVENALGALYRMAKFKIVGWGGHHEDEKWFDCGDSRCVYTLEAPEHATVKTAVLFDLKGLVEDLAEDLEKAPEALLPSFKDGKRLMGILKGPLRSNFQGELLNRKFLQKLEDAYLKQADLSGDEVGGDPSREMPMTAWLEVEPQAGSPTLSEVVVKGDRAFLVVEIPFTFDVKIKRQRFV